MFKDTTLYSPVELKMQRAVRTLFIEENYTLDEIIYLTEKFVYAYLYCEMGMETKQVVEFLGLSDARVRKARESFSFSYQTKTAKKKIARAKKQANKTQDIPTLQAQVLARINKMDAEQKDGEDKNESP